MNKTKTIWNLLLSTPIVWGTILLTTLTTLTKTTAQEVPVKQWGVGEEGRETSNHLQPFNGPFLTTQELAQTDKQTNRLEEFPSSSSQTSPNQVKQNSDPAALTPTNSPGTSQTKPRVTSVSELSDVQPTDWAFQALQSLVERYGCIAGYPDKSFRGNRAITRYEFAAGLNACLDQITQQIAAATANAVSQEDLAALQRLTKEFDPELAELRGRVDNLEARVAQVEASQFSTTTKLTGEAIFLVADAFGDRANNTRANDTKDESSTFFAYRSRLSFQTSFTGRDQLTTSLTALNIPNMGNSTGTQMTRFSIDGSSTNYPDNDVYLDALYYRFPLGDKATVWIGTRTINFPVYTPTLNTLTGNAQNGSIGRFSQFNPTVYRPGFDGAGAAFAYKFNDQLQLHLAYIADNFQANLPNRGLFDSNQAALAQLTFSPSKQVDIGLTYTRKYFIAQSGFNLTGGTGSALARNPFQQNATSSDNFGLEFNWRFSKHFTLAGWIGYTQAHQETGGDSEATIVNGALTFGFPDLFKEGNLGGFIIGVPPKVTSSDYRVAGVRQEDPDTSLHLEAFYRFRVSSNISFTPIVYVVTKPEHNDNNDPIVVGVLRTTFTF